MQKQVAEGGHVSCFYWLPLQECGPEQQFINHCIKENSSNAVLFDLSSKLAQNECKVKMDVTALDVSVKPITVTALSEGRNGFARSNTGNLGSNPSRSMDIYFPFSKFVLSCVDSGLAASWSPTQGVLSTVRKVNSLRSILNVKRPERLIRQRKGNNVHFHYVIRC
jgi:hypothetical protein